MLIKVLLIAAAIAGITVVVIREHEASQPPAPTPLPSGLAPRPSMSLPVACGTPLASVAYWRRKT